MFVHEYNQIIKEHFDLTDNNTRRYIVSLEDAGQEQLLSALSSALYDKIVSKVDEIDFGTIPVSRGDITKVDGFAGTEECLQIIRRLVIEYKQNPAIVDIVLTTIQNIKDRKSLFIKGFSINSELPMLLYNMMVLSVERSTSLMIATSIEYIKDPSSATPVQALNKVAYQRTMDDMLFKQLINFNNMCRGKSLDKILEAAMKNPVHEATEYLHNAPEVEPEEPTPGVTTDPVTTSAVTPGNTVDLFGDDTADQAPCPAPEAPEDDDMTGDTEIPAENEFPEYVPDDDYEPSKIDNSKVFVPAPKEIPAEDDVEPENIPASEPEAPAPTTYINEEDPEDAQEDIANDIDNEFDNPHDETDNGVQIIPQNVSEASLIDAIKVAGSIAAIAVAAGSLIKVGGYLITHTFIPFIRSVIYMHYYTRMRVSDYLAIQADLIEANANELQYSDTDMDSNKKERIIKKQMNWVARLRKWSNSFAIDNKQANNDANKAIDEDSKKKKRVGKDEDGDDSILF